jgi:type I restriction enzyme R subunit/putative DNA methylase
LPHFDVPGLVQHVTFHLADSLPREAIARMQAQVNSMPESERSLARRQRIQELLDSGLGCCLLREAACAEIVEDSLLFGDGARYRLIAWVVMPNHVHVLIEQLPGWPLAKVVQSWKRHTSRQIHRMGYLLGSALGSVLGSVLGSPSCTRQNNTNADCKSAIPGHTPLWQRDYWDRFMRNDRHFLTAKHYIENNPVEAGLCTAAEEWGWGSARFY